MSSEQNKALVRRLFGELFNKGDFSKIPEIFAPSWVNMDPGVPPMMGLEGARQLVSMFRSGFPDMNLKVNEIMADADMVASSFIFSGTQTGEVMGMPPTGKKVKVEGIGIFRISDGKLIQNHVIFDKFGLLEQLGVIPAPAQAKS